MSSRKSITKGSEESFSRSAFFVVKCKTCSAEVLKKDLDRHDEHYCKNIEDFLHKENWKHDILHQFDWEKDFGSSVIIERNLVLLSTFNGIPESKFLFC